MTEDRTSDGRKPPPASIEVEQELLGAILVNNEAYHLVSAFLFPRHFAEALHGEIFRAMAISIGRGERCTPATLMVMLGQRAATTADGHEFNLKGYIARLAASATTVVNALDFGQRILGLAAERELIALAGRMVETTSGGVDAPLVSEQIEAAEAGLSKIRSMIQVGTREGSVAIGDGVDRLVEVAEDVDAGKVTVPSLGFEALNKRFAGGAQPSRLVVVGGRPGMGKTIFMTEISRRLAVKSALSQREEERFAAAIITLEVDVKETAARIVAGDLYDPPTRQIAYRDIMAGFPDTEDRARMIALLKDRRRRLEKLPLYIDHAPGASMTEIAGRVRMMKERARRAGYRLGLVAIDCLGLVAISERYRGNRVAELGEAVLLAKRLAEDEQVFILLGSQLNRGVENRDDKRPMEADLRDSGNIEEHADAIVLLYREAHYLGKDAKKLATTEGMERLLKVAKRLEALVPKNRIGPAGTDRLYIDVACSHIADADRYHE